MSIRPFHLAIPVHNLEQAREFYGRVLGFSEGRSSDHWIDYDCYGHQLVAHLDESMESADKAHNQVDGHAVPVPHFGVVLDMETWQQLADRLKEKGIQFAIEPYIRFKGQPGEQATMFFYDPSGNALEFKAFNDLSQLFAK
ncbi:glyoxalase [Kangiella profundi]|uniref:Glyoxalase n=1 Tax=Kangiella profundi TaxID=1561924 RepID=A0A2K9AJE3_9GAMM|nr:VOC family protein [Kangiella profundi]AUD79064.1 glyoxalase [Kangiella profundi]GGF01778.1 glyoxalase [Kangiella profundi]